MNQEQIAKLIEVLEVGRDAAHEVAQRFHEEMKGYREAEHKQVDKDVADLNEAIAMLEAERALLAAAPPPIQQVPTLIAYVATDLDGRYDVGTTPEKAKERAGHGCDTVFPIYDIGETRAPSPSLAVRDVVEVRQQDILDAARYRWLRDKARSVDWTRHLDANSYQIECRIGAVKMDTDIDAAMREKP